MDRYKVSKMEEDLMESELEQFKDYKNILGTYKKKVLLTKIWYTTAASLGVVSIATALNIFYLNPKDSETTGYLESELPATTELEPQPYEQYFEYLDTVRLSEPQAEEMKKLNSINEASKEPATRPGHFHFTKAAPAYSLDSAIRAAQEQISFNTDKAVKGTVTLVVVIDDTGKVREPKVISGIDQALDTKILEIISNLPAWKPANMNGQAVSSTVTIPVELTINPKK